MMTDEGALESHTVRTIGRRIMPLLAPALFFAYLDRVNLGFAALTMNRDLQLTNTQFGTAAGCFAAGYVIAGIPSTLMLHRVGARRWISLTMLTWGLCSAATAFVTRPQELFSVRLLLGMAEAGLAPGIVVYLGRWLPSEYRGRMFGALFIINPLSQLIGSPLSSVLLAADGRLGLAGWQWLFIVEALPTLVLAAVVFAALADQPSEARWLSAEQAQWLNRRLAAQQLSVPASAGPGAGWRVLADKRVWMLAAIATGIGTSGIGTLIFLPLIIHSMGFSVWSTGFVAAAPAAVAAAALPLWGVWADRVRSREWVVAAGCGLIACGLLGTAVLLPSAWAIAPLCLAVAAFFGCLPAFWALPAAFLTGIGAAAGIALINVAGNLGQFAGPYLLGRLADLSHTHTSGLLCLAAIAAVAAALAAGQTQSVQQRLRRVSNPLER